MQSAEREVGDLQVGDTVNLETDLVARQIVHWLKNTQFNRN